jgi:trans-aconitate 2-methyltransferase
MRDPVQYARFSDERSRPFFTLLSRVPERPYKEIVDLGCGSGELTVAIAERWPDAHVIGLDSSPQMLAASAKFAKPANLDFVLGDVSQYNTPADLVYSNATLQWVEDHETLFPRLAALTKSGGVFATQMPSSFEQPSHLLMEETARTGPWASKVAGWRKMRVLPLRWYVDTLMDLGFEVEAWETVYYFVLEGEDPVVEWVKGTSLQPILSLLDDAERAEYLSVYAEKVRAAYPPSANGSTVFPFKRIFFIGARRE